LFIRFVLFCSLKLLICFLFALELTPQGFKVTIDHQVKLEPREQVTSPYFGFPGNYRNPTQPTPSPQPISPPVFAPISPSPSPYTLQNQLQATPVPMNNFQQSSANLIYPPNIQTPTATFTNGNNIIWNLNGNEPSTSRAFANNIASVTPSSIFNQPLTPLTQNFIASNGNEPMIINSSILIDLDNQLLIDNLSGDLNSLNFSDFAMDTFSRTGERIQNNGNAQNH
jgi:hypothetical protein